MCRCQDYIFINSESFGTSEICGNLYSNSELSGILSNSMKVVFHSSEEQSFTGYFMLVLFVPSECALNGIGSAFFGAIYIIILYIQSVKDHLI